MYRTVLSAAAVLVFAFSVATFARPDPVGASQAISAEAHRLQERIEATSPSHLRVS